MCTNHPKAQRWGFFVVCLSLLIAQDLSAELLNASGFRQIEQSSDDSSGLYPASQALDGNTGTYSLTDNIADSYWQGTLKRSRQITRIELRNRTGGSQTEMGGQILRVFDIEDQTVFTTVVANPGSGGTFSVNLPPGTFGRIIRYGLEGGQMNDAGNFRSGLVEVNVEVVEDLFNLSPASDLRNNGTAWQSTQNGAFTAANALDGNAATFSHTQNIPDSFWQFDLDAPALIERVELVNRGDCCAARLGGLTLRIFDAGSNAVHATAISNPGLGGTWAYDLPPGITGQYIRVGLEGGAQNNQGDFVVSIAEARFPFTPTNGPPPATTFTNNLALNQSSYMVRLLDSVSPANLANDGNLNTESITTTRTVDGYWEVDLGQTYALYGVHAISANGIGDRLNKTTLRLYDENHDSVQHERLTGSGPEYQIDVGGPVPARYVRIGLENKIRANGPGVEWWIGFKENIVLGRPITDVGLLSFSSSTNQINSGQPVTLNWLVEDVHRVELHPAIGSVGSFTDTNGFGSIVLNPTVSTEYQLMAIGPAFTNVMAVTVEVDGATPTPRITEFMADNRYTLEDGFGDTPDWIEIHNPSDQPLDLTGYGLSDDPADPMKWIFPATNISPNGHLIVYASGRSDPSDPLGGIHADFQLANNGESVVLSAPGSNILHTILTYPDQRRDLAYGFNLVGIQRFLEPTPGRFNQADTYIGWLKKVDFSHSRGFHNTPFTLTLTHPAVGEQIWYSTDGTDPTNLYVAGLNITGTLSVRANATQPGYKSPPSKTHTYIFPEDVISSTPWVSPSIVTDPQYTNRIRQGLMDLPTISLNLPGDPDYPEVEGSMEVIWPGSGDHVQENCGISRFGGAWTTFAKKNFRVKFRRKYEKPKLSAPLFDGFDHGVLAKTSFDSLDLVGGGHDMNSRGFYMSGRFAEDSMLDMGSLNPHGRFVHLYLNGVYWGQFHLRERLIDNFLADYLGGSDDDYVVSRGNDNVGNTFPLGTPDPPDRYSWEHLRSNRTNFAVADEVLDTANFIDFMILWNYGNSESEYRSAGPIAAGSGFKFWIADADGFLRTTAGNRTGNNGPAGIFGGLRGEGHPDFMMLLADRLYKHLHHDGALTPTRSSIRLSERMQEIEDSKIAECARWGYRTPANWESSAQNILDTFFPTRAATVFGYYRSAGLYPVFDPPTYNQYGGAVTNGFQPTLTSPDGTIYYTLDGTDPRLPGGAISPVAMVWTPGSVTVTQDVHMVARVLTGGGEWSACTSPHFLITDRQPPGLGDLLITEIHYNPDGADDYEFIEIWNASTNLLDLSGVTISNGVRFIFPPFTTLFPGDFLVVVEDTDAFAARYQNPTSFYYWAGIHVAGEWIGGLGNGGETLSVVTSNQVELLRVPYESGGYWPERTDGDGSSLTLRTPVLAPTTQPDLNEFLGNGRNWRSSSLYHGSPGRFDGFIAPLVINEVLSHTDADVDWIEIYNRSGGTVDLSSFTLTDHLSNPSRYLFPTGTLIAARNFLSLSATNLGFAFSELGSEAALLEMAGSNIVRFIDTVDFPAADREEPFGRFLRSDGNTDFTELRFTTRDASNALPRIGPVVFSEIMYAPASGKAAYLELANITDQPVFLFDTVIFTNNWKVSGVGEFVFPNFTVMQPCSTVILCSTNPAIFRAQYGVPAGIPIFGPWSGGLARSGESLRLLKPGDPEPDGTLPFYRVDHVSFETNGFWPAASLGNISVEKTSIEAYGNDPVYWNTSAPGGSPGTLPPGNPLGLTFSGTNEVDEGTLLMIQVAAANPWQNVTLQPIAAPPTSSFETNSGVFSWTPTEADGPGVYPLTFEATVAGCQPGSATQTIMITVNEVNQPPVWTPMPNILFPAGLNLSLILSATDPDLPTQVLSYAQAGLPPGLNLSSNGTVFGQGQSTGAFAVAVTVWDDQPMPLSATNRFTIRLTDPFTTQIATMSNNHARITFPALTGQAYRVEYSDSLLPPSWQLLTNIPAAPANWISVMDLDASNRQYRVYRAIWER